jgi:hypothetical protein
MMLAQARCCNPSRLSHFASTRACRVSVPCVRCVLDVVYAMRAQRPVRSCPTGPTTSTSSCVAVRGATLRDCSVSIGARSARCCRACSPGCAMTLDEIAASCWSVWEGGGIVSTSASPCARVQAMLGELMEPDQRRALFECGKVRMCCMVIVPLRTSSSSQLPNGLHWTANDQSLGFACLSSRRASEPAGVGASDGGKRVRMP